MQLFARKVNNFDLYANHAWYVPGVKGMFGLLGLFLLGMLLGNMVVLIFSAFLPGEVVMTYSTLIAYPLSFIPAMIYAGVKSQKNSLFEKGYKLSSNHFGPYNGWLVALITVVLTYATMVVADLPNYFNFKLTMSSPLMKQIYDQFTAIMGSLTGGPFWSSFLLVAIFAPVFEEWLCRGMVLRGLLTKMKPAWAIVLSALFFAIIHANPWQALNAFIIGLVMGYVYYKTGSLWMTMLIHFINNGTAVVVAQVTDQPTTEATFWVQEMAQSDYILFYAAGVCVFGLCCWLLSRIPMEQERGNIDEIPVSEEL
ncbi:MAG: CPBP family intramembrane metalloprotease [Bacteroidales bacterium]|nr:CPBP family intramembrane metalloprotease [Bacteroidales bacterium]